jgi:seryl-tRNA synthetase
VLDIRLIRNDPNGVREALARRGPESAATVDRVLELDERWRARTSEAEELRAELNRRSRALKGAPTPEEREGLAELSARGRDLSDDVAKLAADRDAQLLSLPNLPASDAPDTEQVLREEGEAGATGRDHLDLAGPRIDMERAARMSGSRFAYLRGDLVVLELALVSYALQKVIGEGFEPVIPPVLTRERALFGTGFLPDTEQQIYRLADDDLYLIGGGTGLSPRRRDPARRRAAQALCRLLHLLQARGRRGRKGHPRHLPCAPVRQGRDVLLR